jgi:tetratricopeptide (TPR) repeat protein
MAWLELMLNQHEKASSTLNTLLAQTSVPSVLAKALPVKAELLLYQGQITEADRVYQESERNRKQANLPIEPAWLRLGAEIAFHNEQFEKASWLLEEAIAQQRVSGQNGNLIQLLSSLGAVHNALGQYEVALKIHEEALMLARKIGSKYGEVSVVMNLLWSLEALGRLEESISLGKAALALGEFSLTGTLRNNLAWALATLGRHTEAQEHYETNTCDSDPTLRCIAWGRLTKIYQVLGEIEKRNGALAQALALLPQTEFLIAHGQTGLAALEYGSDEQVALVRPRLEGQQIPDPHLKQNLEEALMKRFGVTEWPKP